MKNKIFFFTLMMVFTLPAFGQTKSSVQLHTGGYYILGYERLNGSQFSSPTGIQDNYKSAVALLGIQYQYQLGKNFSVFAAYTMTANQPDFLALNGSSRFATYRNDLDLISKIYNNHYEDAKGLLFYRGNYHFFDAGMSYQYAFSNKHKLTGNLGLSYSYGYNVYQTKLIIPPYYDDQTWNEVIAEVAFRGVHEGYWGAVAGLSYDYFFWKNRLSAGLDVHFRYYENSMPCFLNYGLHVGYSF